MNFSLIPADCSQMSQTYTRAQVSAHNTKDDLWIIINNKVYGPAKFLNDVCAVLPPKALSHGPSTPGAPRSSLTLLACLYMMRLLKVKAATGKDASKDFNEVGHSTDALARLATFHLGDLAEVCHY
jgi:hypothetical protein